MVCFSSPTTSSPKVDDPVQIERKRRETGHNDNEHKAEFKFMRSSKSRSRSKSNRTRNHQSGGNVVNRVFDSSGPEGKVRGTPQQIIDKYNQLARDAHLSNDRVAAENFQQHAEHYMRMLSEAQREQDARREEQDTRREEQERQNRERQAERDRERSERQEREAANRVTSEHVVQQERAAEPVAPEHAPAPVVTPDLANAPQPDLLDLGSNAVSGDENGLVETPESAPKKTRRPRTRKPAVTTETPQPAVAPSSDVDTDVQKPAAVKPRTRRKPAAKSKVADTGDSSEAAE